MSHATVYPVTDLLKKFVTEENIGMLQLGVKTGPNMTTLNLTIPGTDIVEQYQIRGHIGKVKEQLKKELSPLGGTIRSPSPEARAKGVNHLTILFKS